MSSQNGHEGDGHLSHLGSELHSPKPTGKRAALRTVKRSRTGCLTCRARKVKCDESQPICQGCKRCLLECKWPVVEELSAIKARRRTNRAIAGKTYVSDEQRADVGNLARGPDTTQDDTSAACNECRGARHACSQERPLCTRCRQMRIICKYQPTIPVDKPVQNDVPGHVSLPTTGQRGSPHADSNIDNIPKTLLQKHIQAFFTHIHPCQANGFIHRGTMLQNFHSGRIDRKLLLAVCAVASRFVQDPAMSSYDSSLAETWAKEAKTLLILEDMTTDTVAAALLLARHQVNSGSYSSAWMLSSMATRAALALGLNKESRPGDANMPFSEQEARRRLFWACYCLDRMMSTGLSELVILRDEHIRLQLPCEEHQFLFSIPCRTPVVNLEVETHATRQDLLQLQSNIGLFGHYVQVMQMRYSILKYVRNHPENPKAIPPWDPSSAFSECVYKMSTWKKSLPPQFQLLPDTIYTHQSQDQLSPLIMLHVWYEQCMSDLYRIVMPGFPETLPASMLSQAPAGWVEQHQLACMRHASNIASIFEIVSTMVDMEKFVFLDTSLPMCVFESMCVRLQWLFMPPSEGLDERIEECKGSFKILMTYIKNMAKYFKQAKWLLNEMRKMLVRHGIQIATSAESYTNDSSDGEAGSHPWQKRIQRLTDEKSKTTDKNIQQEKEGSIANPAINLHQITIPTEVDQNIIDVNDSLLSRSVDNGSLYQAAGGMNFHDMLYQDNVGILPNGWGEAAVIPDLANFMGLAGEWVANGIDEEPGLANFNGIGGEQPGI